MYSRRRYLTVINRPVVTSRGSGIVTQSIIALCLYNGVYIGVVVAAIKKKPQRKSLLQIL